MGPCWRVSASSSVFHLQTVWQWKQLLDVRYLCVRPDGRHADACPAAAGMRGLWPRCDEHVKPCGAAGERSINPQVSGPLTLYIPAAPHSPPYFSLRSSKLKRKTSGFVNQGWKLFANRPKFTKCACFEGPIAVFILQYICMVNIWDFNLCDGLKTVSDISTVHKHSFLFLKSIWLLMIWSFSSLICRTHLPVLPHFKNICCYSHWWLNPKLETNWANQSFVGGIKNEDITFFYQR